MSSLLLQPTLGMTDEALSAVIMHSPNRPAMNEMDAFALLCGLHSNSISIEQRYQQRPYGKFCNNRKEHDGNEVARMLKI